MIMKNSDPEHPENLDFYRDIITSHNNILTEIDYLVEGRSIFDQPTDPRKIKLDQFLNDLKNHMEDIIRESKMRLEIRNEVERRFDELELEFCCDDCGSEVDSRLGLMKWDRVNNPFTTDEWEIMEKINEALGITVRWVTICKNPDCHKIWKEGEFEDEIVEHKSRILKDKIRAEIKRERGIK